jgi:hypothetical protein
MAGSSIAQQQYEYNKQYIYADPPSLPFHHQIHPQESVPLTTSRTTLNSYHHRIQTSLSSSSAGGSGVVGSP